MCCQRLRIVPIALIGGVNIVHVTGILRGEEFGQVDAARFRGGAVAVAGCRATGSRCGEEGIVLLGNGIELVNGRVDICTGYSGTRIGSTPVDGAWVGVTYHVKTAHGMVGAGACSGVTQIG